MLTAIKKWFSFRSMSMSLTLYPHHRPQLAMDQQLVQQQQLQLPQLHHQLQLLVLARFTSSTGIHLTKPGNIYWAFWQSLVAFIWHYLQSLTYIWQFWSSLETFIWKFWQILVTFIWLFWQNINFRKIVRDVEWTLFTNYVTKICMIISNRGFLIFNFF